MAALTEATHADIWEDGEATIMARVVGADGTAVQQADVTSIGYQIFNLMSGTPDTAVKTGTYTIATVVFDTLQTDARWTVDSTGYNFRATHPTEAGVFDTGGDRYRIEALFNPATGEDFWVVFEVLAQPVRTS